jgi:hypothetical protein
VVVLVQFRKITIQDMLQVAVVVAIQKSPIKPCLAQYPMLLVLAAHPLRDQQLVQQTETQGPLLGLARLLSLPL